VNQRRADAEVSLHVVFGGRWVLTAPAGAYKVGWVDPPIGGEPEVQRALPIDNVLVRRAKLIVPRAELVSEQ
jgi:hypothetical protein